MDVINVVAIKMFFSQIETNKEFGGDE